MNVWMTQHAPKPLLKGRLYLIADSKGPCQLVIWEGEKGNRIFLFHLLGFSLSLFLFSGLWILLLSLSGLHANRLPQPSCSHPLSEMISIPGASMVPLHQTFVVILQDSVVIHQQLSAMPALTMHKTVSKTWNSFLSLFISLLEFPFSFHL